MCIVCDNCYSSTAIPVQICVHHDSFLLLIYLLCMSILAWPVSTHSFLVKLFPLDTVVYEIHMTSPAVCREIMFISLFIEKYCIYSHNTDTSYANFRGSYSLVQDMRLEATFFVL